MVDTRRRRISEEIESSEKTKKKMSDGGGINSLPDSVLHHVLSFLSMKQAIRTSVVSKRWRSLWASIPTLNFTNTEKELMEFVDAVLILRDNNCNIQRLSITNTDDDDDNDNDNDAYYDPDSDSDSDSDSSSNSKSNSNSSNEDDSDSDSDSESDDDSDSGSDYESDDSDYFSDSAADHNLNYSVKNPNSRLNRWILTAVRCNVEEIHLEFYFNSRVKLPHCLFTCKSLRKLKLISLDKDPHELILPDSISLPRLEILHLDGILLHHEGDDRVNTFLSDCCHSIRYLTLKECGIHRKNLNINAPNLKRLVISENSFKKPYLKRRVATGSVRIYAPNLISFHCKDYLLKMYYLENVSSLVKASIDMTVRAKENRVAGVQEKGRNAIIHGGGDKIDFSKLHNVKHLRLSSWAFQIFIATYGLLDSGFTEFQNLRSLKLQTWLSGECICGIIWLLKISPNIVKLSLKIIEDTITPVFPHWNKIKINPSDIGDYWKLPLQPEEHAFYDDHLRDVEIRGLKGRVNELRFLEVLLKNAAVLEKLILVFSFKSRKRGSERRLIKYGEIVHSFPKASSSVKIFFISSKVTV